MTVHGRTITVREAAPGDEAHGEALIEQQNRGALAVKRARDCVERGRKAFLDVGRALQALGEAIKAGEFGDPPPKGRLKPFSLGDFPAHR